MTRDELLAFFDATTAKMRAILVKKNADYTDGAAADPFANFTRVEALGIATTVQGFLTRMTDKLMRINSLSKKGGVGAVADESMADTVLDLANYSILLAAYLYQERLGSPCMDTTKLADRLEKEAGVMDEAQEKAVQQVAKDLSGAPTPPKCWESGRTVNEALKDGLRLCPLAKDGQHDFAGSFPVRDDSGYRYVAECQKCNACAYRDDPRSPGK